MFSLNKISKKIWALFLVSLFTGPMLVAQTNLIEPYDGPLDQKQQAQVQRLTSKETTKRLRIAQINISVFASNIIEVNLFPDISVTLTAQDIGHTGIDLPNWTGTYLPNFTSGAFVLSGKRVSGHVTGIQGNFEIFPLGNDGIHVIVEHKTEAFGGCGTEGAEYNSGHGNNQNNKPPNHITPNPKDNKQDQKNLNLIDPDLENGGIHGIESNGAECFIRVLVGYTSLAQTNTQATFGRTMIEHASLAVLESNQGYANSDVDQRMEMAYLYETPDNETNNACNDNAAQNDPNDGQWDELYTLRNTYDADMCCVITGGLYATNANCNPNGGLCGRAFGFDYTDPDNMFQVSEFDCATGNFTFAHEFGHNQGCRHDNDNTGSPFSYARGLNQGANFRTIMAVCCSPQRINWWSNPDINVMFNGMNFATGTATRDNARALDVGDDDVSHHQTTPGTKVSSTTIDNDHYGSIFGEDEVLSSNVAESGSQLDIRATNKITLTTGFNAKSGSVANIYLVDACASVPYAKTDHESFTFNEPLNSSLKIAVYPNPFSTDFNINILNLPEGELNIYLTDPTGRFVNKVAQESTAQNSYFDKAVSTSSLANGMYYLIVEINGDKHVQKIIKTQ